MNTILYEFFVISVLIAFSLQIIHSIKEHGGRFSLGFFGGGVLFGYLRELLGPKSYTFAASITINNVSIPPPFVPIGWVFTWYLGYELARRILPPGAKFLTVASTFSAFICIPVETAAMNCGWWVLNGWIVNDAVAPVALIGGWFASSVIFLYLCLIIRKEIPLKNLCVPLIVFIFSSIPSPYNLIPISIFLAIAVIIVLFVSITVFNPSLAVIVTTYLLVDLINDFTHQFITNSLFVFIDLAVGLCVIVLIVLETPSQHKYLEF